MGGNFRSFITRERGGNLPFLLLSLLLPIITFPQLNPVYANGIDPPLAWVFNFLIRGNLILGKDIIFPHGPLAFLMYPLPEGNNLVIALIAYYAARVVFAFGFFSSISKRTLPGYLAAIVFAALLLSMLDFLLVLTGIVLMGYYLFLMKRSVTWLILAIVISVFALYIKAFVGIVCISITASFFAVLIFEVWFEKRPRWYLVMILIVPSLILFAWYLLYGTFHGFQRYLKGMMELAGDNSAAVAYYPDNDWWLLSMALILSVILFLLQYRNRIQLKFMIILLPSLFATWKYGMAREDYLHAGMLFQYVVFVIVFIWISTIRQRLISGLAGIAIILLLFLNLRNVYYYEPIRLSFNGIKTLSHWISDYSFHADTCKTASARYTQRNQLVPSLRQVIGNSSTDIFPWDYSFVPVNHLNWQPRPVLQSYACYTPWLDHENAMHFQSSKAPDFLVWELRKITHDIHDGTMESIDGRYLLHDQPETVLTILSGYSLVKKQGGTFPVLLFKKRPTPLRIERKVVSADTITWNQWLDVPAQMGGLQRLKAMIDRNIKGDLKSFLYKDEACFLYLFLENKEIRVYRIVPKNASQGLWVNPLIMNGENGMTEPLVTRIMFRCSNPGFMKDKIPVEWESVRFRNEAIDSVQTHFPFAEVHRMFGKEKALVREHLRFGSNDFEQEYPGWSANPNPETEVSAFSGKTSCSLNGNSFSCAYEIPLDSLLTHGTDTSWLVRADCWAFSPKTCDASLVISIEKDQKPISWKSVRINDFMIDRQEWNYVTNYLQVSRTILETGSVRLKVYAWNIGDTGILVDDMRVMISPY